MKKLFIFTLSTFFLIQTNAQSWNEVQKIVASDRADMDAFGFHVAISADYAVVGVIFEDEDAMGSDSLWNAGSAYIYERDANGSWIQVQKIVASDRATQAQFGWRVSIDGDYLIVSAKWEAKDDTGGNPMHQAGSAYIFKRDTLGVWNQTQKIVASDRNINDLFGVSVSINGDYTIVGALWEDEDSTGFNTLSKAGSAYIFKRDGSGTWNQIQKIVPSDRAANDEFGWPVSINDKHIIVGSRYGDEDTIAGNSMTDAGSAYIFEKDGSGNWTEVQKLVASDREPGDWFGFSVSMSGNYAIVGALLEDENAVGADSMNRSGSTYLYERDGTGHWNVVQKIVASDRGINDGFGWSISMSGDYVIVGAYLEDEDTMGADSMINAGSAYLFKRDSSGQWNEIQKIVASDREAVDEFGISVAINGYKAIIGSWKEDENAVGQDSLFDSGSAYLFESCMMTKETITPIACGSYNSPDGNDIWTSSGTYMDTIPNTRGCDSVITVNLTVIIVDTTVTSSHAVLTATQSGAVYQWLVCENGYIPIGGATGQSFIPANSGIYAVAINKDGCLDTSSCHSLTIARIAEIDFGASFIVYPNPTSGTITIDLGQSYSRISVSIRNLDGQLIATERFKNTRQLDIDIDGSKVYYLVEIQTSAGKSGVVKVLKK